MADLTPIPFPILIKRLFRELAEKKSAFGLPKWKFARARDGLDLSTDIFGRKASTPFGPAAGPHTQLAQNIVLSWLAGGRIIELKTVQVLDELEIARPCIDMATIGFNIEWSQELRLTQSLEEYVKAAMLIEMLKAEGIAAGLHDTVFDMSVGYDLKGIKSPDVQAFLSGMKDASTVIEKLRAEIPDEFARFRDLAYPSLISDSITISTFHGCPPEEIEAIAAHLMEDVGLDVVVKLNPTLLGRERLNAILHDRLGYHDLKVPDATFETDASWDQVKGIVDRLGKRSVRLGRGFGVKFCNTLLVENHRSYFPAGTKDMYMSGAPLHVLAIALVEQFRDAFGDRFPISFSAGVDVGNLADTVALGLKPVSVCSDLLKGAGYGKGADYIADLADRMEEIGATDLGGFAFRTSGITSILIERSDVHLANTRAYARRVREDRRYTLAENAEPPRKTGIELSLLDCETCGKCVPACPNAAIFRYALEKEPVFHAVLPASSLTAEIRPPLPVRMNQQIGIVADICNQCGNCDVICPEFGGPYRIKPQVFLSRESLMDAPGRDGFTAARNGEALEITAQTSGNIVEITAAAETVTARGEGFSLTFDRQATRISGQTDREVDIGHILLLVRIAEAVAARDAHTFLSAALN